MDGVKSFLEAISHWWHAAQQAVQLDYRQIKSEHPATEDDRKRKAWFNGTPEADCHKRPADILPWAVITPGGNSLGFAVLKDEESYWAFLPPGRMTKLWHEVFPTYGESQLDRLYSAAIAEAIRHGREGLLANKLADARAACLSYFDAAYSASDNAAQFIDAQKSDSLLHSISELQPIIVAMSLVNEEAIAPDVKKAAHDTELPYLETSIDHRNHAITRLGKSISFGRKQKAWDFFLKIFETGSEGISRDDVWKQLWADSDPNNVDKQKGVVNDILLTGGIKLEIAANGRGILTVQAV